ncbi:hypothetical protein Rxycam_00590 [Rubrobacter xylanophilus DSM 9941]|uniref:sensor histidine kinase n=1 Tax=Rubrobacter xylanophilus TaxID=49319 RepID=UPI001C63F44C|nr:sensor histidine kinase [Rubrobacter xylanophilus]QYJ14784.1 hypothetical protein Rxycam_00590 [Rubrobacter xylanophilus DSM 9941]
MRTKVKGWTCTRTGRNDPGGWFARVGPEGRRGALLMRAVGFSYVGATYVLYLSGEREFGVLPVTAAFLAAAFLMRVMPWDRGDAAGVRILTIPAFALVSFLIIRMTGFGLTTGFLYAAVANGVFVFGFRWGMAYAGFIVLLLFGDLLWMYPQKGVLWALEQAASWSWPLAFVIGICTLAVEAMKQQIHAQELLAELEDTHAELRRYAERARELAVSEERNRIAREIHDSVGHHLTVVNVQLEAAGKLLARDPGRAAEAVARAKASASEALSEARRAVRALRPPSMGRRAGLRFLDDLVREFHGSGVVVSFEVTGEEHPLPWEVEFVLYRVLQEGLTNALKHSGADRVEVRLELCGETVRLSVTDDGRGASGGTSGGFGLEGLRERVEEVGGRISAGGACGGGFALEVELPAGVGA